MKKRLLSLVLSIGMISTMCSPALATEASIDVFELGVGPRQ